MKIIDKIEEIYKNLPIEMQSPYEETSIIMNGDYFIEYGKEVENLLSTDKFYKDDFYIDDTFISLISYKGYKIIIMKETLEIYFDNEKYGTYPEYFKRIK